MRNEEGLHSSNFDCVPRIQPLPRKKHFIRRLAIDLTTILLLLAPILYLYLWGIPYHRGFNCDDDSLRYPYQDNTISSVALYIYSTSIPIIAILLNELIIIRCHLSSNEIRPTLLSSSHFWKSVLWQFYLQAVPLAFAAASSQLVTDISKYSIGRLRPHFIDRCRPKLSSGEVILRQSNCNQPYTYVLDYTCTSSISGRSLRDSHLSFMSGHSSFAAVCLIYLVIYIQTRVRWSLLGLIKPLIQSLLICLILYTGLSRISDYKHHWSDVLTGLIQGTLVAILVVCFVTDLLKTRSYYRLSRPGSITATNQVDPESGV